MANQELLPLRIEAGGGREKPVFIQRDWTIAALYRLVASELTTGDSTDCFSLLFAGKPLDHTKNVADYEFQPHDRIMFVQQTSGGSDGFRAPPGVQLEMTQEPCCALLDANPNEPRARMPCRCAISKEGVKMMTNATLQKGHWEFECPGCSHKSDFIQMRNLLSSAMTADELDVVNKHIDSNYIRQPLNDIRQCGTCGTYSQRDFSKTWYESTHRAVCFTCTKRAQHTVEFCWYCGQLWKTGNGKSCGNSNCQGPANSLKILATCYTKRIDLVSNVPDTRACPKCGVLISHTKDCKHMEPLLLFLLRLPEGERR